VGISVNSMPSNTLYWVFFSFLFFFFFFFLKKSETELEFLGVVERRIFSQKYPKVKFFQSWLRDLFLGRFFGTIFCDWFPFL
jgi:hypothetical protein